MAACATQAADIATLFHSSEERARLDRLRRGEVPAAAGRPDEAVAPRPKALTGYVKRSDGRSTAFVDGVPIPVAPRTATLLDPKSVGAYASRPSDDLRIERKDPR